MYSPELSSDGFTAGFVAKKETKGGTLEYNIHVNFSIFKQKLTHV